MSKIQIPSKIRAEDFEEKDRDLASKFGAIYNQFVDQLYGLLQKDLDFDNLNRQAVVVQVTINAASKVVNPPIIKTNLKTKVQMVTCGKAVCLSNNLLYPTSAPFVSFDVSDNTLIITNITGLQAGTQYNLTLELIG